MRQERHIVYHSNKFNSHPGLGSCRLQRRQVTRAGEIGTQELWPPPCINHPALSEQHIPGEALTAEWTVHWNWSIACNR